MNLSKRIGLLVELGAYMKKNSNAWLDIKQRAYANNPWFLPEFINLSVDNIVHQFLQKDILTDWIAKYPGIPAETKNPQNVGIVMAGNIPLVGFHDFLCVFISGHHALIKASSKDDILIKHLAEYLIAQAPELSETIQFAELLKNCDAYIATGSNNTGNYFEYYFGKFPNIIRKNRTSIAILTGTETEDELSLLADDVFQYFGMGCRNVTKLYVPENYDFVRLLHAFRKYDYLADHHKYKNNYDYNLALHILNNKMYMSTPSILLVEDKNVFSPVSQLNYEIYNDINIPVKNLENSENVQCIVGKNFVPFGKAQRPSIDDYADGVDVMDWLRSL